MENSKEQGKKKIKEEDLRTVCGGCGGSKPQPKPGRPMTGQELEDNFNALGNRMRVRILSLKGQNEYGTVFAICRLDDSIVTAKVRLDSGGIYTYLSEELELA